MTQASCLLMTVTFCFAQAAACVAVTPIEHATVTPVTYVCDAEPALMLANIPHIELREDWQ